MKSKRVKDFMPEDDSLKPLGYYTQTREEIFSLLPKHASKILDLGSGVGTTSCWLKYIYPTATITAVEGNPTLANELKRNVDQVFIGDLNEIDSYLGSYDLVICLDVLEHLVHPDRVLKRVVDRLHDGATVIISLPNVAHLSVTMPLFFLGQFDYKGKGILDRTHLHFYTEKSALKLAIDAGLSPVAGVISGFDRRLIRVIHLLTLGLFRKRLAVQYIFACQKLALAKAERISWFISTSKGRAARFLPVRPSQ